MASATHQHGPAIAILTSPPLWKSFNSAILCSRSCPCRPVHNVPLTRDKTKGSVCSATFYLSTNGKVLYLSIQSLENSLVPQSCLTLCDPMGTCQAPLSMGVLQARMLGWFAISFSRRSSQLRDWLRSPALQADSLSSESPGMPTSNIMQFNISSHS